MGSKIHKKLFVVSGPSGAGKGTLVAKLLSSLAGVKRSVSVTTRPKRPGEVDGYDYYFLTEEEFEQKREEGEFLESATVHKYLYGTLYSEVKHKLLAGEDVILEIDVQGALQVKKKIPDSILIFIQPPSIAELEHRLKKRQTETPDDFAARIDAALKEMKAAYNYDYVIVNDKVDRAVKELIKVVSEERAKTSTLNI